MDDLEQLLDNPDLAVKTYAFGQLLKREPRVKDVQVTIKPLEGFIEVLIWLDDLAEPISFRDTFFTGEWTASADAPGTILVSKLLLTKTRIAATSF